MHACVIALSSGQRNELRSRERASGGKSAARRAIRVLCSHRQSQTEAIRSYAAIDSRREGQRAHQRTFVPRASVRPAFTMRVICAISSVKCSGARWR